MNQTPQNQSKLEELLNELAFGRAVPTMPDGEPELQQVNPLETKESIISLFKSVVPKKKTGGITGDLEEGYFHDGHNDCRKEILEAIDAL